MASLIINISKDDGIQFYKIDAFSCSSLPSAHNYGKKHFRPHVSYGCAPSKHETTPPSPVAPFLRCLALKLPTYIEYAEKGGYNYIYTANK